MSKRTYDTLGCDGNIDMIRQLGRVSPGREQDSSLLQKAVRKTRVCVSACCTHRVLVLPLAMIGVSYVLYILQSYPRVADQSAYQVRVPIMFFFSVASCSISLTDKCCTTVIVIHLWRRLSFCFVYHTRVDA